MISLIVTGHGGFASGVQAMVEMVYGAEEHCHYLDLMEGTEGGSYNLQLREIVCSAPGPCLVFADLLGGSPFRQAATLAQEFPLRVISGFNVAALLTAMEEREQINDIDELSARVMERGREGFHLYRPGGDEQTDEQTTEQSEQGI